MALLHEAELRPSKLELLEGWAPKQQWFVGENGASLSSVAAFRFDDPEGEIGVETLLVRAGNGPTLQIPVTYRGAPLEGGEAFLIGTMDHSALGPRWVYDGAGDPVYLQTVVSAVLNGEHEVELFIDINGKREQRTPSAHVTGSGLGNHLVSLPVLSELVVHEGEGTTIVDTSARQICVQRIVDGGATRAIGRSADSYRTVETLTGTWHGVSEPQLLVQVRHN